MECIHCKKILSNKWTLKTHQTKSKSCLITQNKHVDETITKYPCTICDKIFTFKHHLKSHIDSCSTKSINTDEIIKNFTEKTSELEKIIADLRLENAVIKAELRIYKHLGECVEEIAKQPKIITTQNTHHQNIQNNKLLQLKPFDLDDIKVQERMLEITTEFFDRNYFNDGQRGVARFAAEKLLRDSDGKLQYTCTDPSRQMFKFRTNNGDIRTDSKAKLLSKMMDETVVKVTKKMVKDMLEGMTPDEFLTVSENFMQIKDINNDNSDFRSELAALTT